jgi:cadmium resistance protein CadD (predicted permease)
MKIFNGKKLALIFGYAFLFNLVWENLHSYFYVHYRGGEITQLVLWRAAAFDAVFITILGFIFLKTPFLKKRIWLSFIFGFIAAVLIEWQALGSGRWIYNEYMPILPLLNVGLTPVIQLGALSYLIFYIVDIKNNDIINKWLKKI